MVMPADMDTCEVAVMFMFMVALAGGAGAGAANMSNRSLEPVEGDVTWPAGAAEVLEAVLNWLKSAKP